jgi:CheY-like chemotaxis protein
VRPRILIVDDDANARSALAELLGESGYDVAVARGGAEGLKLVDSFHPDVLLADAMMPGLSGRALADTVCARPWQPREVLMSPYPRMCTACEAAWLSKPLDVDELLATLAHAVSPAA